MKVKVIWITGLSGAGKTSLANELNMRMKELGVKPIVLDGDQLRHVLLDEEPSKYQREKRLTLGMRYSRLCRLLSSQGFLVIVATISMFKEIHDWNRQNLSGYFEVYLNIPLDELKRRNSNNIYSRFDSKELKNVAGLDVQIDEPANPDLEIKFESTKSVTILSKEVMRTLKTKGLI